MARARVSGALAREPHELSRPELIQEVASLRERFKRAQRLSRIDAIERVVHRLVPLGYCATIVYGVVCVTESLAGQDTKVIVRLLGNLAISQNVVTASCAAAAAVFAFIAIRLGFVVRRERRTREVLEGQVRETIELRQTTVAAAVQAVGAKEERE